MSTGGRYGLQALVFSLVAATFATIYITQPVLPVLRAEFAVSESAASLTVSAVILGIALATLPFGRLADAYPVRRLMLAGGAVVAAASLVCAATHSLGVLVAARFVQGLFVPALTTGLVVYLVRSLPAERLNVVMGSYVSATVAGGLLGRLLGGWIHPPLHWRYAFVTSSVFLVAATLAAFRWLPRTDLPAGSSADLSAVARESREGGRRAEAEARGPADDYRRAEAEARGPGDAHRRAEAEGCPGLAPGDSGFLSLLARGDLRRVYAVAFGAFFVFSSVFNYLPFYLAGPPFTASTEVITLVYLAYLVGVATGPAAGALSDRIGNGATAAFGSALFALALLLSLIPAMAAVVAALLLVCAGFFAIHAAAAGSLNRRLASGRGRANSLYILFYYLGGTAGITVSGEAYGRGGWGAVVAVGLGVLGLVFGAGKEGEGRAAAAGTAGGAAPDLPGAMRSPGPPGPGLR